jgi:hypothetical protein
MQRPPAARIAAASVGAASPARMLPRAGKINIAMGLMPKHNSFTITTGAGTLLARQRRPEARVEGAANHGIGIMVYMM